MEYFNKKMGITDFHISDLDPTVKDKRTQQICEEIIDRGLKISWKVAQGTKIETIRSEKTIDLMADSGCKFLAFSPESGSKRLMKEVINKSFDYEHGLRMTRRMSQVGIRTQGCFLVGIPGETQDDIRQSVDYIKKLVDAGLDEIAVYIFTPLPGAELSSQVKGYDHPSQCTRSPTWRPDYKKVQKYRIQLYMAFILRKLRFPRKIFREVFGLITGKFETKMEMSVFKAIKIKLIRFMPFLFKKLPDSEILRKLNHLIIDINSRKIEL